MSPQKKPEVSFLAEKSPSDFPLNFKNFEEIFKTPNAPEHRELSRPEA